MMKMGLFSLVVLLAWFGVKKKKRLFLKDKKGMFKSIGRFAKGAFGPESNWIQVISTQYLDPKKKLVVARVMNRILILGVTPENIQLITQFTDELQNVNSEEDSPKSFGFDEYLDSERNRPVFDGPPPMKDTIGGIGTDKNAARSRIKNRLEGMRPL